MRRPIAAAIVVAALAGVAAAAFLVYGSRRSAQAPVSSAADITPPRHLLLITVDTLRADRLGVYGWANARTSAMDALAREGARFTHAYAPGPVTLSSHASILTGLYPPGHGARHNGIAARDVPTLATTLKAAGFRTGAFVSAFPLDRRFGLARGFDAYDDHMPRDARAAPANERPGASTVDAALAWLASGPRDGRLFAWVHLFEPHAPYGTPPAGTSPPRPSGWRYDDEVEAADREIARLLAAWPERERTLIVLTADHGEAFGEHGEVGHSIFVYDTTLHVPLIVRGPGVPAGAVVAQPVSLVDVTPTVLRMLEVGGLDSDGLDISGTWAGGSLAGRALYAETFAPLLDFGWAPLRALRRDGWKYIAAPRPELYRTSVDPLEKTNVVAAHPDVAAPLRAQVDRMSPDTLPARAAAPLDREAAARLRALGYASSGAASAGPRPDPKDRIGIASRLAAVTSGELQGPALEGALRDILAQDPRNPQAHLRLGYVLAESERCAAAESHFTAAIAAGLPSADAHLGLALCLRARGADARQTLRDARGVEPGNPIVDANLGLAELDVGRVEAAVPLLSAAVAADPELHQARFALARALARLGRRNEAADHARELLSRLPAGAPQRAEVERLLQALR